MYATRLNQLLATSRSSSLWTVAAATPVTSARRIVSSALRYGRHLSSAYAIGSQPRLANNLFAGDHPIRQLVTATRRLRLAEMFGLNGGTLSDAQQAFGGAQVVCDYRYRDLAVLQ